MNEEIVRLLSFVTDKKSAIECIRARALDSMFQRINSHDGMIVIYERRAVFGVVEKIDSEMMVSYRSIETRGTTVFRQNYDEETSYRNPDVQTDITDVHMFSEETKQWSFCNIHLLPDGMQTFVSSSQAEICVMNLQKQYERNSFGFFTNPRMQSKTIYKRGFAEELNSVQLAELLKNPLYDLVFMSKIQY
jgi:hypothetical protein